MKRFILRSNKPLSTISNPTGSLAWCAFVTLIFGKLCRVKRKSDVSYFSEFHQTQPLAQPLLSESGPLSRRAWKGELLASGFCFWEQTGGTSFQEKAAARGGLFQDTIRTPLLQVSGLPASSTVEVWFYRTLLTLSSLCLWLSFDWIEQSKFKDGAKHAGAGSDESYSY